MSADGKLDVVLGSTRDVGRPLGSIGKPIKNAQVMM